MNNNEVYWHYTNTRGLHGILKSKFLRMSEVEYLNDFSELRHAGDVFWHLAGSLNNDGRPSVLFDIKPSKIEDSDWRYICARFFDGSFYISGPPNTFSPGPHISTFIGSFSKCEDKLSQWRGYSLPGNAAAIGFRLGLSEPRIVRCLSKDSNKGSKSDGTEDYVFGGTVDCVYCSSQQLQKLAAKSLKELLVETAELLSGSQVENMFSILSKEKQKEIATKILFEMARFKHNTFAEEEERRVIRIIPRLDIDSVFHRGSSLYDANSTENGFKVAFKYDVKEDLASGNYEIMMGPRGDIWETGSEVNNRLALHQICEMADIEMPKKEIRFSSIPFR